MEIKKTKCKELINNEKKDIEMWINFSDPARKIKEETKEKVIKVEFIKKEKIKLSDYLFECVNCPSSKEEIEFENCYDIKINIGRESFLLPPIDTVCGCIGENESLKDDVVPKIVRAIEIEWEGIKKLKK